MYHPREFHEVEQDREILEGMRDALEDIYSGASEHEAAALIDKLSDAGFMVVIAPWR